MSVTAVPLRPLERGTIPKMWIGIFLLLAIGAGVAWLTTSHLQYGQASNGIRYRVLDAGTGQPIGRDDLGRMEIELSGPDGRVIESTARRVDPQTGRVGVLLPLNLEAFPEPMAPLKDKLRAGGVYQVTGPASALLGPNLPANLSASDQVEFRIRIRTVEPGGMVALRQRAAQQQMMQQQQLQQMQEQMPPGGAPVAPPAPGSR